MQDLHDDLLAPALYGQLMDRHGGGAFDVLRTVSSAKAACGVWCSCCCAAVGYVLAFPVLHPTFSWTIFKANTLPLGVTYAVRKFIGTALNYAGLAAGEASRAPWPATGASSHQR